MIKNDISVRFCIWDFDDIKDEEISKNLDLKPYKVYTKGVKVSEKSARLSKRNGWIYGMPYDCGYDFEEQLTKILDVFESKILLLKEYSEKYFCEFSCALFLNNNEESAPVVNLGKRFFSFMKEIDAEFDFEIYNPSPE